MDIVSSLFFISVISLIVVTVKKSDAQPHLDPPLRHLYGGAAHNPWNDYYRQQQSQSISRPSLPHPLPNSRQLLFHAQLKRLALQGLVSAHRKAEHTLTQSGAMISGAPQPVEVQRLIDLVNAQSIVARMYGMRELFEGGRHFQPPAIQREDFYNVNRLIKDLKKIDTPENSEFPAENKIFQRWHSRDNSDGILRDDLQHDLTAAFDDVPVNSVAEANARRLEFILEDPSSSSLE